MITAAESVASHKMVSGGTQVICIGNGTEASMPPAQYHFPIVFSFLVLKGIL